MKTLSKRKWSLEIVETARINLDLNVMNYVDHERGYVFLQSLERRRRELREPFRMFGLVIWPLVVKKEEMQLVDGYCRFTTLKGMNISRVYACLGNL